MRHRSSRSAGNLQPLDEAIDMDQPRSDYSQDWIDQGSVGGQETVATATQREEALAR